MRDRIARPTLIALTVCFALVVGCEQGFVNRQARSSVAAFLTGVLGDAINGTINDTNN